MLGLKSAKPPNGSLFIVPPPNASLPPKGSGFGAGLLFVEGILGPDIGFGLTGAGGRGGGAFFCLGGTAGIGEDPFFLFVGLKGSAPKGSVPND